jgi:hypothetical protein
MPYKCLGFFLHRKCKRVFDNVEIMNLEHASCFSPEEIIVKCELICDKGVI